jgi:hypothetical protein
VVVACLASQEKYLRGRIKVNGKVGSLGTAGAAAFAVVRAVGSGCGVRLQCIH